eukprot:gene3227-3534_t
MPYQPKAKAFDVGIDPNVNKTELLKDIVYDCALAFNCRAIESEDENYSTGCTYFIRDNETPKTGLEQLAQEIFRLHSRGKTFNPALSGAEWWTQVIDERDDIGVHWDRDYGMEEEMGMHVYPHFATVTYFAEKGSPTVIFDQPGTIDHSFEFVGKFKAMEFSRPTLCKHIAFPGNLLHAAPSAIMFGEDEEGSLTGDEEEDEEEEEEEEDRVVFVEEEEETSGPDDDHSGRKVTTTAASSSSAPVVPPTCSLEGEETFQSILDHIQEKRITFLVNIWFNHIPSQSVRCGEDLFPKFKTTTAKDLFRLKPSPATMSTDRTIFPLKDEDCSRSVTLKFVANEIKYEVLMPLPTTDYLWEILNKDEMAAMEYTGNSLVELKYAANQADSDEEEEEEEGIIEEGEEVEDENVTGVDEDEEEEELEEDEQEEEEEEKRVKENGRTEKKKQFAVATTSSPNGVVRKRAKLA